MMDFENPKERKRDRRVVLKTKDGMKPKSGNGLIDPRVFTGENELHCIQDQVSLWSFKYKMGGLPEAMKGKFTTFELALEHAKRYFSARNIEVSEVID